MQDKKQIISPIKQRILAFAMTLGISKREFYARIGVSRGTLESKTSITEDVMTKFIATYPDVSLVWLLTGNGSMLKSDISSSFNQSIKGNNNNLAGSNSTIIKENTETSNLSSLVGEYKKLIGEQNSQIRDLLLEQKRLHDQIDKLIDKIK